MKLKKYLLAGSLAVVLGTSGNIGCRQETSPPPVRTEVAEDQDRQITRQVETLLKDAAVYKFPDVQVQSRNGEVQLSGFVQTADQKQAAADIVKQVPGVANVINNITVQ